VLGHQRIVLAVEDRTEKDLEAKVSREKVTEDKNGEAKHKQGSQKLREGLKQLRREMKKSK
jgi:hypothetical protein